MSLVPGHPEPHRPYTRGPLRKAAKSDYIHFNAQGKLSTRVSAKPKGSFGIKEKKQNIKSYKKA